MFEAIAHSSLGMFVTTVLPSLGLYTGKEGFCEEECWAVPLAQQPA